MRSIKESNWYPFKRDTVLLSQRVGLWQWYWSLGLIALSAGLIVFVIYLQGYLFGFFAYITNTERQLLLYDNTSISKNNIYSFIDFVYFGIVLILISCLSLSLRKGKFNLGLLYNTHFSWTPFWRSIGAISVTLFAGLLYIFLTTPEQITLQNLPHQILPWIALGLFVLFFQTLAEEILFRGYLLRVIGALLPFRFILVVSFSIIFTLIHGDNPDFKRDYWWFLIYFFTTELVNYWLLFRTQSVMSTWGVHYANNVYVILIVAMQPGWKNDVSIFVYTDPVLSKGGSYLLNAEAYIVHLIGIMIFVTLIVWKRSPFHLPKVEENHSRSETSASPP